MTVAVVVVKGRGERAPRLLSLVPLVVAVQYGQSDVDIVPEQKED